MMLPELQDIADFDAPAYGQELEFLDDIEELGQITGTVRGGVRGGFNPYSARTSSSRQAAIAAAAAAKKRTSPKPTKTPLKIIKSSTSTKRRFPTKRSAPVTREEKIRGIVKEDLERAETLDPAHRQLAKNYALDAISGKIKSDLMPKLNAIYAMLDKQRVQTSATDEHNIILNTQQFRRKVLNDLLVIASQLPKNHPLRARIQAKRRSLGLF